MLEQKEGFVSTEKVWLGRHRVDNFKKPNDLGGTDYVEVDDMLKMGIPNSRYRKKLAIELGFLGKNDRLVFIDKKDPAKRIVYRYGDGPGVVATRNCKKLGGG